MGWESLDSSNLDELINKTKDLISGLGDDIINPEGDRHAFVHNVQPRLWTFLKAVIDNRDLIKDLKTEHSDLQNKIEVDHQGLLAKINSFDKQLKNLQVTADTLNSLSQQQQGELGILLQAQRIRKDAQTAKEQALQLAQMAQNEADEAQLIAPDALSIEAIMNRVTDVRQASEKAVSSAIKAIAAADKATQHVASLAESNVQINLSADEDKQPASDSAGTSTISPVEAQATGEISEPPEELVGVARSYVDEAIKFKDEAQKIASEIKDLASRINQEYDNWSVVQNLFSIAK